MEIKHPVGWFFLSAANRLGLMKLPVIVVDQLLAYSLVPNGTSSGSFGAYSLNSYKTHVCCVFEPHVLHSETKSTSLVFKLAR